MSADIRPRRCPGELVEQLHVLAGGKASLFGKPPTGHGVELDLLAPDAEIDAGDASQIA